MRERRNRISPACLQARCLLKISAALTLATGWLHAAPCDPDDLPVEWTEPDGTKPSHGAFGGEFHGRTEILDSRLTMYDAATKSRKPTKTGVSQLTLSFKHAMAPASFAVNDDIIAFTGLGGGNLMPSITGMTWESSNTALKKQTLIVR